MKVSCIKHPVNERLIVIRQWQLNYCDGNVTQAALLSFFEYWHNVKLDLCAKKKAPGKNVTESGLIQHHTEEELAIGILHIAKSEKTIRNAIKALAKKQVISILKNPDSRKGFDKTKHYRFHPEIVNAWLEAATGKITECTTTRGSKEQLAENLHSPSIGKITECTTTRDSKEQLAENPHCSSIGKITGSKRENYRIEAVKLPNRNGKITATSPKTSIETTIENTHTNEKNENSSDECACVSLNDFEKAAWDWAQSHSFWKGRITSVNALRKNLKSGTAFQVQFEEECGHKNLVPSRAVQTLQNGVQTKRSKFDQSAIDQCPYCDEVGIVSFEYPNENNRIVSGSIPGCDHKAANVQRLVEDKRVTRIKSALSQNQYDFVDKKPDVQVKHDYSQTRQKLERMRKGPGEKPVHLDRGS